MADRAKRWTRRVPRTAPAARWRRWAAGLASVRRRAAIGRSRPPLVLAVRPRPSASTPAARARLDRRPGVPLASPALVLGGGATTLRRVRDERRRIEQRTAQATRSHARLASHAVAAAPTPALAAPMTFNAAWV